MENQVQNTQGEKVVSILEQFNLFWNVSKQPLNVIGSDNEIITTDLYGVMRDDTKKVFTSVKEGYEVYQNWELVELLQKVAEKTDLEIGNGGSFNGGGKIFLQMNSGTVKGIGENNDTINKRLTAINSHDGSTSLSWGQTNVTVSCQNSFHLASKTLGNRVRHTASMRYKIEDALRQIDALREEEKSLFEKFFRMADVQATNQDVISVVKAVSGVDINQTPTKAGEMYHTRQINRAEQVTKRISEEMSYKGQTLWGLFSGVTSYTSKDIKADANSTLQGKFMGSIGKIDNKVLDMLTV